MARTASVDSLHAKKAAIEAQIEKHSAREKAAAIARIRADITAAGLLPGDLMADTAINGNGATHTSKGNGKAKAEKAPSIAKFRDPATGSTWTGKGRRPFWVIDAMKNGKLEALAV